MILAHHLIWTGYGWWLPNDPRGSMSREIVSDVIAELGELHYGRKAVQPASAEIRAFYDRAADALKHPLRTLSNKDVRQIAVSFDQTIQRHKYTCYACAVMPDHVHLLLRKHKHDADEMIGHFQEESRRLLTGNGWPEDHPVWGGPGWKVYLDSPDDIRRTIEYVRRNPVKMRLPAQSWPFVTEYDGWPFHKGYNPRSPYARFGKGQPFRKS